MKRKQQKGRHRRSGCTGYQSHFSNRRDFISIGSLAIGGLSLGQFFATRSAMGANQERSSSSNALDIKAKNVIQIVCGGGIAAQESWNPKPDSPLENRGPFGVAKTKIPGIVLSSTLPQCAKIAEKLCVVRSIVGSIPDHGLALYHMLTGYRPSTAIKHPSVGSVVSHQLGPRAGLPAYIAIPQIGFDGSSTGYLSPKYGPFSVGGDPADGKNFQVRDLKLPSGVDEKEFKRRKSLRDIVNNEFKKLESDTPKIETMDSFYQQAYQMISSQRVREAFDLSKESDKTLAEYGMGKYLSRGTYGIPYGAQAGMRMLLARRLVEAGARFVTLTFGGWDDHTQIREAYQARMPAFDNALATLINDLDNKGMLDNTLVWVASEFGRTPKINSSAGRDHWAKVFSIALAGGGLKQGLFYGDSDATSSVAEKKPMPLSDLHATIYRLMGIDSNKELMAPGDRPIEIVKGGKVNQELIA